MLEYNYATAPESWLEIDNMTILFTKKKLDKQLISKKLGEQFSYDFLEVIKIKPRKVDPFELKDYSLIFTSVNGVESFFNNGFLPNEKFTEKYYNRIYCVGKKTKEALRKRGFGTFKVKRHAKELSEFIIANSSDEKFIHFCGNLSLDVLNQEEPLQSVFYRKVVLYDTELLYPTASREYKVVVFFSPSGVRSFIKNNSLEDKKIFSIGHTTKKELRKHTSAPIITSDESNIHDLLELILANT